MCFNNQNPADVHRYLQSVVGGQFRLSRNIRLYEVTSDTDEVLVHPATVLGVQALRDRWQRPIWITNWYRSEGHNRRVGGRPASRHMLGMAADVVVVGVPPSEVADYAEEIGFGGVGRYQEMTHVDTYGEGRRWDKTTPMNETP